MIEATIVWLWVLGLLDIFWGGESERTFLFAAITVTGRWDLKWHLE